MRVKSLLPSAKTGRSNLLLSNGKIDIMKETIKAINLTTGYRQRGQERRVGENINASLYSGELTALLGRNGAGKSTLMRTLAGFQPPLEGRVEVEGRSITDIKGRDLARTIGVVLTEKPALENMDAEALVGLGRMPYTGFWGALGEEDKAAVDRAIRLVGIEDLRKREVQGLSDGERQKVMIAKALAQDTPVIFLDEPTAFLDYPSKVELMELLRELARSEDKTIFVSTHDLEIALRLSDRFWELDKKNGLTVRTDRDAIWEEWNRMDYSSTSNSKSSPKRSSAGASSSRS